MYLRVIFTVFFVSQGAVAEDAEEMDWQKLRFTQKLVSSMSAGTKTLELSELLELSKLSKQEIAANLMSKPEFSFAMLDHLSYFLGIKQDNIWLQLPDRRVLNFVLLTESSLIEAVRAFEKGRDFWQAFLQDNPPVFLNYPNTPSLPDDDKNDLSDEEVRKRLRLIVEEDIRTIRGLILAEESDICSAYETMRDHAAGYGSVLTPPFNFVFSYSFTRCNREIQQRTTQQRLDDLQHYRDIQFTIFDRIDAIVADGYQIERLSDLEAVSVTDTYGESIHTRFSFFFWQDFGNSSTNMNRKRGAHILKTFLCDDLMPLPIVTETGSRGHVGLGSLEKSSDHGSDPGCQACHYKLDPMAGFFRNHGPLGIDFTQANLHLFGDNLILTGEKKQEYLANWYSEDPNRKWEVGYVKSPTNEAQNTYGESLSDLMEILRNEPEVSGCFVRRSAEYFLGPNMTLDSGWLSYMTKQFQMQSDKNQAYRQLVSTIVLSQSFQKQDPVPGVCYDKDPTDSESSPLPCQVASIIEDNCEGCHNSETNYGHLNLSEWLDEERTFPYQDENGVQRPRKQVFYRIRDRLVDTDPSKRMPLFRSLSDQQRTKLYHWLQSMAEEEI